MTPNPESALNEAAGKFLIEDYGAFCRHAALMTRIHARPGATSPSSVLDDQNSAPNNQQAVEGTRGGSTATERKKPASCAPPVIFSETRRKLRRL